MTRLISMFCLSALALGSIACNPATAKDKSTVWVDLLEAEEGVYGRGINVIARVDAQARDMDTTMEINLSVLAEADSQPNVEMLLFETLEPISARTSDGTAEIVREGGFEACDGPGFSIRDNGGCTYEAGLLLLSPDPHSVVVNYSLKAWADEAWEGDPDSVDIIVDLTTAN